MLEGDKVLQDPRRGCSSLVYISGCYRLTAPYSQPTQFPRVNDGETKDHRLSGNGSRHLTHSRKSQIFSRDHELRVRGQVIHKNGEEESEAEKIHALHLEHYQP